MPIKNNFNSVINNISQRIERNKKAAIILAANEAVNFSVNRFDEQNWIDTHTEPWASRKHGAERDKGRALLIDSGHLRNSIRIITITGNKITIGTSGIEYAKIHNTGGITHPRVTQKMRKYAWAKYKTTKNPKWKGIALTKKETLDVKIPKRQFMGKSMYLSKRLRRIVFSQLLKH